MRRDEGLAAALFATVIGVAIAAAIASDITAPLCEAASAASPQAKFEFGCLEFWLNRYQSLIVGILTAGVAVVTIYWISGQLRAANRQAAVSAATSLRIVAAEIKSVHDEAFKSKSIIDKCRNSALLTQIEEVETGLTAFEYMHFAGSTLADLNPLRPKMHLWLSNQFQGEIDEAIRSARRKLNDVVKEVEALNGWAANQQAIESNGDDDEYDCFLQMSDCLSRTDDYLVVAGEAFGSVVTALYTRRQALWAQIRRLEAEASG